MSDRETFWTRFDALWYDGITGTSHHQQLEAHRALRRLVAEELAKGDAKTPVYDDPGLEYVRHVVESLPTGPVITEVGSGENDGTM